MKKRKVNQKTERQVTVFRRAAREVGADESEGHFNAALKAIGKGKLKRSVPKRRVPEKN